MSDFKTIDEEVIEQLAELVDEDEPNFLTDLLQGYVDSITQQLPELLQLANEVEAVKIVKTAHSLKGASGNIGATRMAELFRKLELAAGAEDNDTTVKLIRELQSEFQVVRADLEQLL